MAIDIEAAVHIQAPREAVAAYAMNPEHDPTWIGGIKEVRMLTAPPVTSGTRVARVASFLGRRIEYVLEVVEHQPGSVLGMKSVAGPFPMQVTYRFERAGEGTRARIRVQGEASGFFRLAESLLARSVQRSVSRDLEALKRLLESRTERL